MSYNFFGLQELRVEDASNKSYLALVTSTLAEPITFHKSETGKFSNTLNVGENWCMDIEIA